VKAYIFFLLSIQTEIDKLEGRKAANLELIAKYERIKNIRGKIPEPTLEKIAELRQANEGYDDTIKWLREAQFRP
jgi:hypothetical protein